MNKNLFLEIVNSMDKDIDLEDFTYVYKEKIYGFLVNEDEVWINEGKCESKGESAQLVELDNKGDVIQKLPFGVSRSIYRSGSYFSDYDYEYDPFDSYEINEVTIPEVIIPEHTEEQWNEIK